MDKAKFYDRVRAAFGPLSQSQVEGFEALLNAWDAQGGTDGKQLAYVLATVWHEVARTMQPIAEYGKGKNRTYGGRVKYNGKPYIDTTNIFYGRGFTQNTWYEIYAKLSKVLGVDLIQNPDLLIIDIELSAKASVYSMIKGLYTGKSLRRYINEVKVDYINARRIINGLDKADLIAGYAVKFEACIEAASQENTG